MILVLAALLACRTPTGEPAPKAAHFAEWQRLVDAAAEADLDTARVVARDLTHDGDDDHEGTATVGGALGFLQLATDPEDLADGVASAAKGCGECHATRQVPAPALSPWSHETAARRAVEALLWNDASPPPAATGPADAAIAGAWTPGDVEGSAAAVMLTCARCHTNP